MKKSKDILTIVLCSIATFVMLVLIGFGLFLAIKSEMSDSEVQAIDWVLVGTLVLTLGLYVNMFFSKFVNACKSVHAKRKATKKYNAVRSNRPI